MTYVAKGTPAGHDVKTAIDYLNSFNSGAPMLKIHSTGIVGASVSHNLGYPPFHFITYNPGDLAPGGVDQFAFNNFAVNSTQLRRYTGSMSRRYFIARLDLTQNFTAQYLPGDKTASPKSFDYVFKLAREGKDVASTDMRDFALHSETTAPLVHMVRNAPMVNTGGGLGWEYSVNHGLDYTPTAFAFIAPGANSLGYPVGEYGYVPGPVGASGMYYTVNATSVYMTADNDFFTGTPQASIVVLKNPFTLQTINRTYP
jgi:hypothetical protein